MFDGSFSGSVLLPIASPPLSFPVAADQKAEQLELRLKEKAGAFTVGNGMR